MVTITKPTKRSNVTLYKKLAVSVSLFFLLCIGIHWLSWFVSIISSEGNSSKRVKGSIASNTNINDNNQSLRKAEQQPMPKIKGVPQPKNKRDEHEQSLLVYQQKSKVILSRLDQLSNSIPLSPPSHQQQDANSNNMESKFLSAVRKECIPGQDDSGGDINPTTHRKRECLRHVPLGKKSNNGDGSIELQERMKRQKPRIGILITPGFIGRDFAHWIAEALTITGGYSNVHMDVEIIITSHVPVYGYGKSHGYTKLIRLVTLPMALAVSDAYLYASSKVEEVVTLDDGNELKEDALDEMKSDTIGKILQLILRWNCRISHVSAHTAMLTLSLEDIIKDPTKMLANILAFVWRDDWEWEGHGGAHHHGSLQGEWTQEAENLITNHGGALQKLLERTTLFLDETIASADGNHAFAKSIQGAFASEMSRSSDMTAWPCPSFWEGVDSGGDAISSGDDQMRVLQQISDEMVPNCSDDDPFARCTVNRDRCEVKRDAKCK